MDVLEVNDLYVSYGSIKAIKGISLKVEEGEIVAFIGANGAGKTTLLRTISKLEQKESGKIFLYGKDLDDVKPYDIINLKMAQVPEGRQIFPNLTVLENLELGAFKEKDKKIVKERLEKMYERFPRLKERKNQLAGTLSGGEQQMLAMARSLMSDPKVLLLDEPSMGLSPILVSEIFDIIKDINKNGVTILLVEQNAKMALGISDYAYVIENGKIVLEGKKEDLLESENVKKAYLGM